MMQAKRETLKSSFETLQFEQLVFTDSPGRLFERHNPKTLQFGERDVLDWIPSALPRWIQLDFQQLLELHRCLAQHQNSHYQFQHHLLYCGIGSTHIWKAMIQATRCSYASKEAM